MTFYLIILLGQIDINSFINFYKHSFIYVLKLYWCLAIINLGVVCKGNDLPSTSGSVDHHIRPDRHG